MESTHDHSRARRPPDELESHWGRVVGRRGFLVGVGAAGAAALAGGALGDGRAAFADSGRLSRGDAAILRFLAAAELLETDLWQQYAELGGVNGGNPAYIAALENLDGDMPQYISDNTDDERSHAAFLNAYLRVEGRGAGEPGRVPHAPEQQGDGREADRPADEPAEAERRHELVHPLPQHARTRTSGPRSRRPCNITDEPAIPLNDTDTPPGMSQPVPPTTAQAAADAGDREHGRVPLRDDRAGRLEPLHDDEPQGDRASRCCGSSSRSAGSR